MTRTERVFLVDELPIVPSVAGPGVLVAAPPGGAVPRLGPTRVPIVYIAGSAPARLDDLRSAPAVASLTLTTGDVGTGTRVAVSLATHLRWLRSARTSDGGPVVTAVTPDETTLVVGLTKIVHFVTLNGPTGLSDRAVWEWMTPAAAIRWFGGPLPEIARLHQQLDVLLRLRRLARQGRLPATVDSAEAADRLRGRYWSGRWLLEHHLLVGRLVNLHLARKENQ